MYLKIMDLRVGLLILIHFINGMYIRARNISFVVLEQILFTICVSKDMKFGRVRGWTEHKKHFNFQIFFRFRSCWLVNRNVNLTSLVNFLKLELNTEFEFVKYQHSKNELNWILTILKHLLIINLQL